jgi:hypothetical protein
MVFHIKYGGKMIQPLNGYYHIQFLEPRQKGSLILNIEDKAKVRLVQIISCPLKQELDLRPGDCVYIMQHYGLQLEEKNELLIKDDYILAEYIDK